MGRQGGHTSRSAAVNLRGEAARGRPDALRLQHPEGVDAPPRPPPARRGVRPVPRHARQEVQLREEHMSQVLRSAPAQGDELQEEAVWTLVAAASQEKAEVNLWQLVFVVM